MDFSIFFFLTIFGICKGNDNLQVPLGHSETQILDTIDTSEDLNKTYIAGYYKIIKERNDEIMKLNLLIAERKKQISYYEKEVIKCNLNTSSYPPFKNFTDTKQIRLPGSGEPLDVLYNSQVAGSGWIVIQQRINGKVSFDRNWANYSEGFGSFDGDFFLGLKYIHRLTSFRRYELFIYLRSESQIIEYARYDDFEIAGEDEQYKLISLGKYIGSNLRGLEYMRASENMRFHTIDRDNDMNCAKEWHSGWWYANGEYCNLNGVYGQPVKGLYWGTLHNIEKVLMLIRRKID